MQLCSHAISCLFDRLTRRYFQTWEVLSQTAHRYHVGMQPVVHFWPTWAYSWCLTANPSMHTCFSGKQTTLSSSISPQDYMEHLGRKKAYLIPYLSLLREKQSRNHTSLPLSPNLGSHTTRNIKTKLLGLRSRGISPIHPGWQSICILQASWWCKFRWVLYRSSKWRRPLSIN